MCDKSEKHFKKCKNGNFHENNKVLENRKSSKKINLLRSRTNVKLIEQYKDPYINNRYELRSWSRLVASMEKEEKIISTSS